MRDHDFDDDELIAPLVRLGIADSLAAQSQADAARGAGGHLHVDVPFGKCGDFDLRAERGFGGGDRHVDQQVAPLAVKVGMRSDADRQQQIAGWSACRAGLTLAG